MQLVKLNEAASSDIEQLIQNREWSKAYQVASGFEKQDVIRQFINQLPNN